MGYEIGQKAKLDKDWRYFFIYFFERQILNKAKIFIYFSIT